MQGIILFLYSLQWSIFSNYYLYIKFIIIIFFLKLHIYEIHK